jgi:hypothetical protein
LKPIKFEEDTDIRCFREFLQSPQNINLKKRFELQEASLKAPCTSTKLGLFYNLTTSFFSIKLKEEIRLNNVAE